MANAKYEIKSCKIQNASSYGIWNNHKEDWHSVGYDSYEHATKQLTTIIRKEIARGMV